MKIHICLLVVLLIVHEMKCGDFREKSKTIKTITSSGAAEESPNDLAVRRMLAAIENRKFHDDDDANLLELMKKGVSEAAMLIQENPKASFQAAHKKAQDLVSNITASYTQAILKSKSPGEAKQTLHRFQRMIKKIVDYTKSGVFLQ